MDIDKMITGLDSYFKNTPKEHFDEVWNRVKKYETYGPDVEDFLDKESSHMGADSSIPVSYTRLASYSNDAIEMSK